jgi:polysaccharide biosynthesis transport protein
MPEAEETSSGNPGLSRLSILRTIWKRKIRIVSAWILFAAVAAVIVRYLPAVYLAESVVLIDSQKIPEKFVSATVASDLEDRIAAIRQMLLSGGELKKVIDEFGLYQDQRKTHFEEEILEMMRKDISITVEAVGNGNTKRPGAFHIGYQGSDPNLVMRVANRLTDLYVDQNIKTREGEAAGTSQFLDTQLVESKKRLDQLEAAVSVYKLQHNGELPQQEGSITNSLSRLQTQLEANRDAINRAQQTRVILDNSAGALEATLQAQIRSWEQTQHLVATGVSTRFGEDPVKKKKASEVLEEQLAILSVRYTEGHPDMVRMRADLAQVKVQEKQDEAKDAEAAAKNAPKPGEIAVNRPMPNEPVEFAHVREQVSSIQAQIKGSDKELADRKVEQQRILHDLDAYQHRIERLPVREQEMAQLTRDYEMSKENYKSLLDKKMAAEMSLDMERRQQSERFIVLDRAQLPEKPIKPKRPLLYGAGAGIGLVLALVLGFSAELRKNVILGEWELPEDTPVLARLPHIEVPIPPTETPSPARRRLFGRKKTLASAAATTLMRF